MPELPEVEHARRQLRAWLVGERLVDVGARPGPPLRQTTPTALARLRGHVLRRVDRRGKHLALRFDGDLGLYLHLGMTGKLVRRAPGESAPRFSKVVFTTASAEVHFCDSRRFGRVRLLTAKRLAALPELAALGPDAWDELPRVAALHALLAKQRRPLTFALLDQRLLAGLGNLHAVEALWRARLSPLARTEALTRAQVKALRAGIRASLAYGLKELEAEAGDTHYVEEGGDNPFFVYGRAGQKCRRCGATIARIVQAQRSTYYCPGCQRG